MQTSARSVALTGSDQAVRATPGTYHGFSVRETAGAVAVFRVYDNASAGSGTLLDTVALGAGESRAEHYPGQGLRCDAGVYVKIVSGTVEGSVRVG